MELCKHLSYRRSLSPGKAVFFYQTVESDFVPLRVEVAKIVGQKSGYSEGFAANFEPKNVERHALAHGNPQTIESCYVPPNVGELFCRFSLRVEANSLRPDSCSDPAVTQTLSRLAQQYQVRGGYLELARRYCKNLLMGTWLWRNQHTLGTRIEVTTSQGSTFVVEDARHLSWSGDWPEAEWLSLEKLAEEMSKALSEPSVFWFADITARLKTGFCQEVFPSQRFVERPDNHDEPSKTLATTACPDGQMAACFHAQKVGAALQQIDDWWSEDADQALRIHEYGADRKHLTSMRHPVSGKDFFHLLARADELVELMAGQSVSPEVFGDIHYAMAVLVKGGLFQAGKAG